MSSGAVIRKGRVRPPNLNILSVPVEQEQPHDCILSQINPSVFISGYEAARNQDLLVSSSITHILNLVGELKCPNPYSSSFQYYSLKMPDNPKIDILFFLYFAMNFIIETLKVKGKILVHCVKGTSRAVAVALAYLMLQGYSEQEAYSVLASAHPNTDPNLSFVCQLRELQVAKQEARVFYYSDKYEMFVNIERPNSSRIEIISKSCTLYLLPNTEPRQEHCAFESIRLWEHFNSSLASVVYL